MPRKYRNPERDLDRLLKAPPVKTVLKLSALGWTGVGAWKLYQYLQEKANGTQAT